MREILCAAPLRGGTLAAGTAAHGDGSLATVIGAGTRNRAFAFDFRGGELGGSRPVHAVWCATPTVDRVRFSSVEEALLDLEGMYLRCIAGGWPVGPVARPEMQAPWGCGDVLDGTQRLGIHRADGRAGCQGGGRS